MFKYRDHRGSLAESIETVQEFNDLQALLDYLRKSFKEFGFEFTDKALKIKPYCYDKRINWDTHIVTIDNFGVVGFTNANPQLEKMECKKGIRRSNTNDEIYGSIMREVKHRTSILRQIMDV